MPVKIYQVSEIDSVTESKQAAAKQTLKRTRKSLLLNLVIFCLWYILLYSGFWAMTSLQSTMNAAGGMGPDSQAVLYAFAMVSALLLPKLLIEKWGCKLILLAGNLACCAYVAANMYLRMDTLLLGAALFGFVTGPFISTQVFYIDKMATRFHATVSESLETIMACFFGAYALSLQVSGVLGSVISYMVLRPEEVAKNIQTNNASAHLNCGVNFEREERDAFNNTNLAEPSEGKRILLTGILLCMGFSAAVFLVFLKPLKDRVPIDDSENSLCSHLMASLKHLRKCDQIYILPITIFIGMESAFYSNEVTEAFIACSWGVHHVGYVTICFGVCGAVMAVAVGPLVKCISQVAVLILAASADVILCALLYIWKPDPDRVIEYFLFAGVWGMSDAIWWSQISALYGLMFPDDREAAFSNLYFWSFLGFFLCYIYANYFTVPVKINILLSFLVIGMLGYLIGQFKHKRSRRREYITSF